jgi:hypothetical protein
LFLVVTIETSGALVCTQFQVSDYKLKVFWLAYWAIGWGPYTRNTIFVARLAFLLLILIITQWAICYKQALLFSLNQLIVLNALCATCICVAITIFA